jgi:hypothetical protein
MKLVSPPSGALANSPIGYDPVSGLPTSGTFCLCTTVSGKLTQWWNYDFGRTRCPRGSWSQSFRSRRPRRRWRTWSAHPVRRDFRCKS